MFNKELLKLFGLYALFLAPYSKSRDRFHPCLLILYSGQLEIAIVSALPAKPVSIYKILSCTLSLSLSNPGQIMVTLSDI